jgi:DNA-binding SARP family transcriptional activator/tetratricopeptide (TPR) repeat protein/DNA-binding XRE family transcriptional regulator
MGSQRGRPPGALAALWRTRRESAGLTQRQLAHRAGISLGALEDLEQGRTVRPRRESLAGLAAALRLSPDQLEEDAGPPAAPAAPRGNGNRAAGLRVEVLGPLAVWRDGLPVPLGPVRQRAVLGLLVLHAGTSLNRATIIDALWGSDPPPTSVAMVQAQVGRIRRTLGSGPAPGDGARLSWDGSGYQLTLDGIGLDLAEFGELTDQARAATAAGNAVAACELYDRALRLWRGHVLEDIELLYADPGVTGLARRRDAVVIEYAAAAASAGLPGRVLAHLEALTAREPLDERAHAELMMILAATGRQAAALRAYQDLAGRLDTELGVRPGPELSAAHQRVLRQQIPVAGTPTAGNAAPPPRAAGPAGDQRRSGPAGDQRRSGPEVPGRVVPRQLPPAVPGFAGRAGELTALTGLLDQVAASAGTVVISAIGGTAGVGKTALAVHWAHQVAGRFPDGQLYINLRGFGPSAAPVAPAEAVRQLLDGLGVAPKRIPADLDAQVAIYRSLLSGTRMLIIADNAHDAAQLRPLLPGAPGCLVLVTSRNRLTGLAAREGAHLLTLDTLSEAEARELLAERLGRQRVAAEPAAVAELTRLCARLPLALSVVAARAAARPRHPLAALAAQLGNTSTRLDRLGTGDAATDVRTVFSWSCEQLSEPAARLFRLLGVHPGPDISAAAAASLAGLPPGRAHVALTELISAHLVTEHAPGRYACHDLLRAYAVEQVRSVDSEGARRAALHRVLDHYLHTSHSAAQLLQPQRGKLPIAPAQPGVTAEHLAGHEEALAWFKADHRVLVAITSLAAESAFDTCAWQLPWCLATFLDWQGHWHDWAVTQRIALAAVTRRDDEEAQATVRRAFAAACIRLGDYGEAHTHLTECLDIYTRLGDRAGEGRVLRDLGSLFEYQGRYAEAAEYAEQALNVSEAIADRAGQAAALTNIGDYHMTLGNHQQALTYCRRALKLHRALGARYGEAHTWLSLGRVNDHLGDLTEAAACHRQGLTMFRELGDRVFEATALSFLGDTEHSAGRDEAARLAWQQALAIFDDLNHPDAEGVRSRLGQNPAGNDSAPADTPHCAECAPVGNGPLPVRDR